MARRSAIDSVLHNFLGTYTSRYSEIDGYWLLGWIVKEVDRLHIDLMAISPMACGASEPLDVARTHAVRCFADQVEKAHVARWITRAELVIRRSDATGTAVIYPRQRTGWDVRFEATAISDVGNAYRRSVTVFVAAHDPGMESRSARGREWVDRVRIEP